MLLKVDCLPNAVGKQPSIVKGLNGIGRLHGFINVSSNGVHVKTEL